MNTPFCDLQTRSTSPDLRTLRRKLNYSAHTISPSISSTATPMDTEEMTNHDVCDACGGVGQFICCDACPNAFHFTCVEPPMNVADVDSLKGKWYCNECEQKKKKKRRLNKSAGLFQCLMDDMSTRNPKTYKLPDPIINFFNGVASDKEGRYIDTTQMKSIKHKHGTDAYYNRLKDRSGGFIQCYYCRKTAFNKPMISCDYCSLFWHLDCLNPPMASAPHANKRWRCPNHIENILGTKRQQKKPTIFNTDHSSCAYYNLIDTIIEDEFKTKHKSRLLSTTAYPREDIITHKNGTVYRLPVNSFQLDLSQCIKSRIPSSIHKRQPSITPTMISSSSSDISTPPTSLSPISLTPTANENHKDMDEKLNWFQTEADNETHILNLIRKATQLSVPSSPIPDRHRKKIPFKKYQRYQHIKHLLQQKDEQEILTLLNTMK